MRQFLDIVRHLFESDPIDFKAFKAKRAAARKVVTLGVTALQSLPASVTFTKYSRFNH